MYLLCSVCFRVYGANLWLSESARLRTAWWLVYGDFSEEPYLAVAETDPSNTHGHSGLSWTDERPRHGRVSAVQLMMMS